MDEVNIALVAEEAAGTRALQTLASHEHVSVALVLTSGHDGVAPVRHAADRLDLPTDSATRAADPAFADDLRASSVDLLLNVHSLEVLPEQVVSAPSIGSFNLHPGPIPAYPGLNAPSWAIYDGATTFGSTLHWMSTVIDAGPIAYAATFALSVDETALTLSARCVQEGMPLLGRLLDDAATGQIPRRPQGRDHVTRTRGAGPPNTGRVDWSMSADQLAAFVRSCDYGPFESPWGKPATTFGGTDVYLSRATALAAHAPGPPGEVVSIEGSDALVATGKGLLRVSRLVVGGRPLRPTALVEPGSRFSA